jgi:hypothetical protein
MSTVCQETMDRHPIQVIEMSPGKFQWLRWARGADGKWRAETSEETFPTEKAALIAGLCSD